MPWICCARKNCWTVRRLKKFWSGNCPTAILFVCRNRIEKGFFYVCFGHMIETLNHDTDKHGYDLLIIATTPRATAKKGNFDEGKSLCGIHFCRFPSRL